MNGWIAFQTGLSRLRNYWPVIVIVFAVNILTAFVLTLLPALSLLGPAHRTAIRQAADGVDSWLLLETFMSPQINNALGTAVGATGADLQDVILQAALAFVSALPLAWLPAAFLNGGILLTYAESPNPFGWRRFLWGCWHWFGALVLLGMVQSILLLAICVPLIVLSIIVVVNVGRWLLWIAVPFLALVVLVWLAVSEYSGAFMICQGARNPLRGMGQAARYVFRRPMAVFGLYGLALLLLALVNAIYHLGLNPVLPLAWWPLVLGARQAFVAARLCARLARWAGSIAMIVK